MSNVETTKTKAPSKFVNLPFNVNWNDADKDWVAKQLKLTDEQREAFFVDGGKFKMLRTDFEAFDEAFDNREDESEDEDEAEDVELGADGKPADEQETTEDAEDEDAEDVVDVSVATTSGRTAIEAGELLGEQFAKDFEAGYKAREQVNITPLLLRNDMKADLKDKMDFMPFPKSYLKGGKVYIGTGDKRQEIVFSGNETPRWDKYTYQEQNDDGKMVKKSASFIRQMFLASSRGVELKKEFDLWADAVKSFNKNASIAMPAKCKGYTKPQCVRRRNRADSRIKFGVNNIGTATKLHLQCLKFDSLRLVGYRFEQEKIDGVDEYVNRNEPVQVFSITYSTKTEGNKTTEIQKEGEPSNLSIGAFLRYDVDAAIAKAEGDRNKVTFAMLQETVQRDRDQQNDKSTKKEDWSKTVIRTMNEYTNVVSSMVDYLTEGGEAEEGDTSNKRVAMIVEACAKDEDTLRAVGDMILGNDAIWKQIEGAYTTSALKRTQTRLREQQNKTREDNKKTGTK